MYERALHLGASPVWFPPSLSLPWRIKWCLLLPGCAFHYLQVVLFCLCRSSASSFWGTSTSLFHTWYGACVITFRCLALQHKNTLLSYQVQWSVIKWQFGVSRFDGLHRSRKQRRFACVVESSESEFQGWLLEQRRNKLPFTEIRLLQERGRQEMSPLMLLTDIWGLFVWCRKLWHWLIGPDFLVPKQQKHFLAVWVPAKNWISALLEPLEWICSLRTGFESLTKIWFTWTNLLGHDSWPGSWISLFKESKNGFGIHNIKSIWKKNFLYLLLTRAWFRISSLKQLNSWQLLMRHYLRERFTLEGFAHGIIEFILGLLWSYVFLWGKRGPF